MTYRRLTRLAVISAFVVASSVAAFAQLNVKLGTLAPDNSPWATALKTMGEGWKTVVPKLGAIAGEQD